MTTSTPKVSIITPSFNQAQFIERTMLSVLHQNYPNLEYIVLDSLSTDGTANILEKYAHCCTVIQEKDDGQSDAINNGFNRCSGEIMAYINSDDCYASEMIVSRAVELFANNPDVDVIYGTRDYIDEKGYFLLNYPYREFDRQLLVRTCYIPQECVFWRRSIYEKAGGFVDKSLKFAMDYDLWLRFLKAESRWLSVDEKFGLFRWYPGQKSRDVWMKHGVPEIAKLQEQHLGKALPEDEMIALYQEYYYGAHRLNNMWSFAKSVPVWNAYIAKKRVLLSTLPKDYWVLNKQLELHNCRVGFISNWLQSFEKFCDKTLSESRYS